jgi:hypothetical protein
MMIDATVAPQVGFIRPFGTTVCNVNHINAPGELLVKNASVLAVSSTGLFKYAVDAAVVCSLSLQ